MKSYKRLFDKAASFQNLSRAYRKARRGKRDKPEVIAFDLRQEEEIIALEGELRDGTYRPGGYRSFYIYEPKKRLISAAPFRDRVVHHAICNVVEPLFEKRFIFDSYSCRLGKGTHKALDRFTYYARRYPFVLKADIVQYFPSIDHEVLLHMLGRTLADKRLMKLVRLIVDSGKDVLRDEYEMKYFPGDDLFAKLRPRGLPIGNLTSQFLANVYLDRLDHFVKEDLCVRGYLRYCDDFVIFGDSREELVETRATIVGYLRSLRLRLHERKSVVYRTRAGVPFLGFLVYPDHRRLLRRSVTRARRRFRCLTDAYTAGEASVEDVRTRVMAWLGHVKHGDTWGLRKRLLNATRFRRKDGLDGHTDLCEDLRLESVAVPEDQRVPQAIPPYADAST